MSNKHISSIGRQVLTRHRLNFNLIYIIYASMYTYTYVTSFLLPLDIFLFYFRHVFSFYILSKFHAWPNVPKCLSSLIILSIYQLCCYLSFETLTLYKLFIQNSHFRFPPLRHEGFRSRCMCSPVCFQEGLPLILAVRSALIV